MSYYRDSRTGLNRFGGKKATPYSKMSLSKLREIETDILKKHPDMENSLKLYHQEQRKLELHKNEYEGIQRRLEELRMIGKERRQKKFEEAGFFRRLGMNHLPIYTDPEIEEMNGCDNLKLTHPTGK